MRFPAPALATGLLVLGGVLGWVSDETRATPRPPPDLSGALGGFNALAVQVLWFRADQAWKRDDYSELLYYYSLIADLEPQLTSLADYLATEIGHHMANAYPDPATQGALACTGYEILTHSLERNLTDPEAHRLRGEYALLRVAPKPARADAFLARYGRSPREAAQADLAEAHRLWPQDVELLFPYGSATQAFALELILDAYDEGDDDDPRYARAAALVPESVRAYERLVEFFESRPEPVSTEDERRFIAFSKDLARLAGAQPPERDALYAALYDAAGGSRSGWPPPRSPSR